MSTPSAPPLVAEHPLDLINALALERAAKIKEEKRKPQRRIMIIGTSGSGKTYAASSCPKPVYDDYDNQLNDPVVISRLHAVYPMWDTEFVQQKLGLKGSPDKVFKDLLTAHHSKLTLDHTVVWDSASYFSDRLKENLTERIPKGKEGDKDGYWYWREWANAWRSICEKIAKLECNFVAIFHESEIRDEATGRLEKYGWMMQGKEFTPRIPQFFTDVVRQLHVVDSVPNTGAIKEEKWLWQIKPTTDFPIAKTRCTVNNLYIPASWNAIIK